MTDLQPSFPSMSVADLNKTPLNQYVLALFEQEKTRPEPHCLALVALAFWAEEHLTQVEPRWLEERVDKLRVAHMDNPEALDEHLAEAQSQIMSTDSLADAAMALLRHLADLMPNR